METIKIKFKIRNLERVYLGSRKQINLTDAQVRFLGSLDIVQWWKSKDGYNLEILDNDKFEKFLLCI